MADQQTPSTAIPVKVVSVDQAGAFVTSTAVTIADNGNAVEGALNDAAITTNATGSISGKLRGVVALLAGGIAVSWAAAQHVITDATSVTNATLAAETTKVIGTVNQGTSPWVGSVASTTLTATVQPAGVAAVSDNRLTVATAGTAQQFPSVAAKSVAVTAETDNTGYIVIGGSSVVAALATRRGLPLAAGDTAIFAVANINELYIDTTVNGDGVTYVVLV